jgi:hypothetical protein
LQLLQNRHNICPSVKKFTANGHPFRNDVTGATVVSGMGRFDVLASWGHPVRRVRDGLGFEEWTYYDVDADSGDALEYNLVFRNGVLDRWSSRTHKNTGVAYKGRQEGKSEEDEEQQKVTPSEPPAGKKVPKS